MFAARDPRLWKALRVVSTFGKWVTSATPSSMVSGLRRAEQDGQRVGRPDAEGPGAGVHVDQQVGVRLGRLDLGDGGIAAELVGHVGEAGPSADGEPLHRGHGGDQPARHHEQEREDRGVEANALGSSSRSGARWSRRPPGLIPASSG